MTTTALSDFTASSDASGGKLCPAGDTSAGSSRPRVCGKFIYVGNEKLYIKGVTYGPFEPESDGSEYHTPQMVERDFALMAGHGINAVRTYTVPPRWLLDLAQRNRLRVMVGIPWEQHIAFLDQPQTIERIEMGVRAAVRSCSGHPAVLCFSIGNEIPAPIVRWHGRQAVERFLENLYTIAKKEDPEALVTYVNYPSTEYLNLPFLDFLAFNVYLESPETLTRYLGRLQNLAGDRPLLMAEVGLDTLRNGESKQAAVLDWQIRTAFVEGAAGLFLFSWTDEWFRGGQNIHDWKFGLTTVDRQPKLALEVVQAAFAAAPLSPGPDWPMVSVVVCTYNGARTLRRCLSAVGRISYPRYEIIVVDDGSTDASAAIAAEFGVNPISIPNGGLSNARNIGWRRAKGKIVAYVDDDAMPDIHWLTYLVSTLMRSNFAGVAGPNLAPPNDGFVAGCVDHSPGNPTHVLLDDREAEHLPGCNMAFWRECIESVGGFDPTFCIAGDDVDFCWRLQAHGWVLGFSPAAVVWHHRRATVKTYWKQQMNYGRAEAMLERKWPDKYNAVGHLSWAGRVYAKACPSFTFWSRQRIYHGTWGTALFQSIYSVAPHSWASALIMPEWYLIVSLLGSGAVAGIFYQPLQWMAVPFGVAALVSVLRAVMVVAHIRLQIPAGSRWNRLRYRIAVTGLHLMQPAARLWGRLTFGLTPWRKRGAWPFAYPWKRTAAIWDETWRSSEDRLTELETNLKHSGAHVVRGGDFDGWDLEVRAGFLMDVRMLMTTEEHGQGKQYVRIKVWPVGSHWVFIMAPILAAVAMSAAFQLDVTQALLLNCLCVLL
ncbi:MAG: glycosyltransferase, partial [Opitutaceae bacterium]